MVLLVSVCSQAQATPTPTVTPVPTPTATSIPTPTPTSAPTPVPQPFHYEDLLGLIPDTLQTRRIVYINDYALLRKLHDVPLPGLDVSAKDLLGYVLALCPLGQFKMAQRPFVSGFNEFVNTTTGLFRDSLAFDLKDVDQSVLAGVEPGMLEVVRGRFDPEATDRKLRACLDCPQTVREEHLGVSLL